MYGLIRCLYNYWVIISILFLQIWFTATGPAAGRLDPDILAAGRSDPGTPAAVRAADRLGPDIPAAARAAGRLGPGIPAAARAAGRLGPGIPTADRSDPDTPAAARAAGRLGSDILAAVPENLQVSSVLSPYCLHCLTDSPPDAPVSLLSHWILLDSAFFCIKCRDVFSFRVDIFQIPGFSV